MRLYTCLEQSMRLPNTFSLHTMRYGQDARDSRPGPEQTYTRVLLPPSSRDSTVPHCCWVECLSVSACISSLFRQPCFIGTATLRQSVRWSPSIVGEINGTPGCLAVADIVWRLVLSSGVKPFGVASKTGFVVAGMPTFLWDRRIQLWSPLGAI